MTELPRFLHLRVHSEYSLLEGAVRLKSLPGRIAAMGMPAVALTDSDNMFAALEFSETAAKAGVQPILGCQMSLAYGEAPSPGRPAPLAPLVLLAQSETGWRNLLQLNSRLYLGHEGAAPHLTLEEVTAAAEGLICLTGGADGPLGQLIRAGQETAAERLLDRLAGGFGDRLYIELQRHPGEDGALPASEAAAEPGLVDLAYAFDLPLVATNDAYFEAPEMFEAHDALICIAEGAYVDQQAPRRRLTPEHWLKPPEAMAALFADLPEALESTVEIAQRCAVRARTHPPILPRFAEDEVEELRRQAQEGLAARLAVIPHAVPVADYEARLTRELGIIERMGFPGYFLIVADFIKWAKARDIPVGPGRGSGAGSLVAYALTITDLDPLRYNLLFERFLNPDRVSMPDFDIDFCMDRREEVIAYVQEKYGRDRVGQIITFGALLSKAAVRDIGRVLQMPYGQVDRLAKMIPVEGVKPVSVEKALAEEPRLREEAQREEVVDRLLSYASQVEGLLRNASTHAAGVVIGDRPLDALVPLYRDPRSEMPATQFNMKWVEAAGLVKFDFLGLKTLTAIQNALALIRASGRPLHQAADGRQLYEPAPGTENDIGQIPLDDPGTYALYAAARTVAVFQVESSGMMDALRRMKPTSIEDIIALVALYRPGPMENIPAFCEVKNGLRERASIHPLIDHILDETQGIIVYQEQVMQIAQEMAGYSLGGADLLRRAMGKKIQAAMDAERPKFLAGAKENGVEEAKAVEVWNLLDKFANYGFNKSHAAAYAVVSYQTAWLKANHPVEFMAGVMNCDLHLTDKLAVFSDEAKRRLEIEIVPPCVNRSDAAFTAEDGRLVYALGALKNVGPEAMRLLVAARRDQPFATLFDLARRVDLRRIGKRPLEMLAKAGAFDALDRNRRRVFEGLDGLIAYSAAVHDQRGSAQVSLFGEAGEDLPEPRMPRADDWLPSERLAEEHAAVGFYLSGHPLDDYASALKRAGVRSRRALFETAQREAQIGKIAGTVAGRQERKSARGNRFAFVQLSDPDGGFEVTVFSDTLEAARGHLEPGVNVVMTVEATRSEDGEEKLLCRGAQPIDAVVTGPEPVGLRVYLDDSADFEALVTLIGRLTEAGGQARAPLQLCLQVSPAPLADERADPIREVELDWPQTVVSTPQARGAIRSLPGIFAVEDL